jgi:hypothetical protein
VADATRVELEGVRAEAPPDLDAAFRGDAVRAAFESALGAPDVSGEISAVDCSEFPCIVHGRLKLAGLDDEKDLEVLIREVAGGYDGADMYVSQTLFREDPADDTSPGEQIFSAAFDPRGLAPDLKSNIDKRLRFRKNEYRDASKP